MTALVFTYLILFYFSTPVQEFDSELKNMDDVVLAVAKGRKFGLGKHLPRHFRSRLHHAVNRIQRRLTIILLFCNLSLHILIFSSF